MEFLSTIFNFILNTLGSTIFIAIVLFLLGVLCKMKVSKAFSSAITFAVAFSGISLVIGYMSGAISPVAQGMLETIGKQFSVIDGGWATLASITWSWPYAFVLFPFQIIINLIMFAFGKTKTINIDLWNVWGKAFQCCLITTLTGSIIIGLVISAIRIILELVIGDSMQPLVEEKSGIPGITSPHGAFMFGSVLYPFELLLRKVHFIENSKLDVAWLKQKLGIFAENHIIGFMLGIVYGLIGGQNWVASLTLGIECATALTLLPMVTKLFMTAFSPLTEACSTFMKSKTKNRDDIFVGLDAAVLLGNPEIWISAIITVPAYMIWSIVLPGELNQILPLGGIVNLALAVCVYYVAKGNLVKMLIYSCLIGAPVFLIIGTACAPLISELAINNGIIASGTLISNSALDAPVFVYGFTWIFDILKGGSILPLFVAIYWAFGCYLMVRDMKNYGETKKIKESL